MLGSLNTAVSGLEQFQTELDVISNNIANSNTVGFKSARIEFEDTFNQTLLSAGNNPSQIGTGVATGAVTNDFGNGNLATTGVQTDLAINGDGFFVVSDPNSGVQYATRAGNFYIDTNGYLVTNQGFRLQGFNDSGLSSRGDLMIDTGGADASVSVKQWSINSDGKINVALTDGTTIVRGQVLLQNFTQPQALIKEGGNLYSNIAGAGPLGGTSPESAAPTTQGLGPLKQGYLEMSNVDLATEFANLITSQRGFQANARMVTTSDEVLQELVNMKH
jgi:flagellar hook protein FlgE